jgi:hypothetical protein
MSSRSYGYLYDRDRRVKDDAALIRSTIKTMTGAGVLPADWKYSVRYRRFAGGCSIDIDARSPRPIRLMDSGYYAAAPGRDRYLTLAIEGEMKPCIISAGQQWHVRACDVNTAEVTAVYDALNELLRACNHDGSDIMTDYFDVKFYGVPSIGTLPGVPRAAHRSPSYLPASCGVR